MPSSLYGADDPPDGDDSVGYELRELTVDAALHGQRLDKVLVTLAPEFSRNHLQSLVERGHVHVDGKPAEVVARKLRAGQKLRLELVPTEESRAFRPQPMALDIVFEDEHLLVLDKPAGLVVHPA
ncbi:MAG: S4 domain-containing protein, partial [Burkholderiaceae bacterium]|nr:S4 domain-containing protein [Burkholderiaceae bacterium]